MKPVKALMLRGRHHLAIAIMQNLPRSNPIQEKQ
jgi:hypothetical protein